MAFSDLLLGVDMVCLPRLAEDHHRYGRRFFQKILTPEELRYCESGRAGDLIRRAGSRIAAKEAVSKALGVGMNGLGWVKGLPWHSVEIQASYGFPPHLVLYGEARRLAEQHQITQWRLSLSHDGDYALATVIGLIEG